MLFEKQETTKTISKDRILFAAQPSDSRDVITKTLGDNGHEVEHNNSYQELAARSDVNEFNIILVDLSNTPADGFGAIQELHLRGITLPIIGLTPEITSDLTYQAKKLGLFTLLGTPILPERLVYTVKSALQASQTSGFDNTPIDPNALMLQTLELAVKSATSQKGRAFGAILADQNGNVIAEGHAPSRDNKNPLNFAESTAIRRACETLKTMDLSSYILFSSFEPTNLGKALIKHVKIKTVYYSLTPENITPQGPAIITKQSEEGYHQICLEEAKRIFSIKS